MLGQACCWAFPRALHQLRVVLACDSPQVIKHLFVASSPHAWHGLPERSSRQPLPVAPQGEEGTE